MWKNSWKDGTLVLVALAESVGKFLWLFYSQEISLTIHIGLVVVFSLFYFFNIIVVTHNFIHTPFFRWSVLNDVFYIFNSANAFFPITLYLENHLMHHAYNNDRLKNGSTLDPTSTFLYGKNGKHENVVKYSALGVFRDWTLSDIDHVKKKGKLPRFIVELSLIFGLIAFAAWWNWQWIFYALLPTYLLGWFLSNMQNYYEHYHAKNPEEKYGNSVSYYGRIYNFFMFNEGYHQEHHILPGAHWTTRPAILEKNRERMKSSGYHIARVPPSFGFLDRS